MAHHKSALKRIRQDKVRRLRNRSYRTRMRNVIKSVRRAIDQNDLEKAKSKYQEMVPLIDKLVSKKIIHQNTAARMKSRLNKRIHNLVKEGS